MLQVPRLLFPRLHREHDRWYLPRDYQGKSRAGEIQDQTSQHYRWIDLSGVKQVATGCNKICCDTAGYKISRYEKVFNQIKSMLIKVACTGTFQVTRRNRPRVLEHRPVQVYTKDSQTGPDVDCSDGVCRILGWQPQTSVCLTHSYDNDLM